MWKIIMWIIAVIWSVTLFTEVWKRYRNEKSRINLIKVVATIFMFIGGIILLIAEIIE